MRTTPRYLLPRLLLGSVLALNGWWAYTSQQFGLFLVVLGGMAVMHYVMRALRSDSWLWWA